VIAELIARAAKELRHLRRETSLVSLFCDAGGSQTPGGLPDEAWRADRRSWLGFTMMCLGLFMAILDIQIVASALPRIATSLHTPLDELSWVQTSYLITEVIAIALSGRLARALSTRWLFAGASLGFVLTSLGCGLSHDYVSLIVWRTLQGFFAGTMVPTVFAAGYKMFPKALHARAILIAGALAMLAPSVGPLAGGYVAEKLAWNWLFFINIPIGLAITVVVATVVRVDKPDGTASRTLDTIAFIALAVSLASLETLLKVAPEDHWAALRDYALLVVTVATGTLFIRRCMNTREALVDLAPLRTLGFSIACAYNFVLGVALYGSIYLLPLFLGFVRFHTPLEIGEIMTVMGVSQLVAAPLATIADRRLPARWVVAIGFGLFAAGAFGNAFQTPTTDFAGLLVPQILRGAALLFCILPITNVALDELPSEALSGASGLLNFMRNIGGAVGIGVVDTIVNVRPHAITTRLLDELVKGKATTAAFVGIPRDLLAGVDIAHADPGDIAFVKPIIARAAATVAFNDAWMVIGGILVLSFVLAPFLCRSSRVVAHESETVLERLAHDVPSAMS
jgi:MFS transporter, DHA2 family, multidrug resistance protein